jgi:hypothetical protein
MKYFTEKELQEIAQEKSKKITIRTFKNGCSSDDPRESTSEERENIYKILYAGLLALNFRHGKEYQGVLDACEFMGHMFLPENTNSYDTIYRTLDDFYRDNK